MEFVILSFWFLLLLFILRLAYLVLQTYQKTSRHKPKNIRTFQFPRPSSGRKINSKQWGELLKLVHGDVATANRLVDYELKRNPGRSVDWCVDKALWQLRRDRR